ncbi:MAG TPA: hypothetical protein VEA16_15600 [Vicinamibacterales bacterium]|nr:hypothetical protein [Vicinamibacterales bacterium]
MTRLPNISGFKSSGWPLAAALLIRLSVWLAIPSTRFASDEESYYQVGTALLSGRQDVFWPPVTGWLIALVRFVTGSDSLSVVRLAWIAMDLACVLAIGVLAARLGRAVWPDDDSRARRLSWCSAAAYALYLPAISYSQFATSETPALLATLLVLVAVTTPEASVARFAGGGLLAGLQCLARPSLLPLLIVVPLAAVSTRRRTGDYRKVLAFIGIGALVVGAYVARNWIYAGQATISTNSAYNLYIGNRDMYAEDLDLFNPRATPEQIEFRRQQFSGTLPPFTQTPAESQRLAVQWIRDHPALFAKRALGRLARVFVPKTDVLELRGGESRAGVFAPASVALLTVANVQWAVILFGGLAGLILLRHRDRYWFRLMSGVIAGALVLCLIAISKPRYSFVFDPILIMCAAMLLIEGRNQLKSFTAVDRRGLAAMFAFLLWGWVAFLIFSITSRAAM